MSAASPVRYPDLNAPQVMTRRAWWLVVLNVLIPGSAQLLAGSRRLGRFGVGTTFMLWVLVLLGVVLYFLAPSVLFTVASTTIGLWALTALLLFYAVLWVVLALDTLRMTKLVRVAPKARGWIAGLSIIALVVTGGGAAYGAYLAFTANSFITDVFITAPSEPPVNGRYNIMLLGGDAGPDRDGMRPDSISVVSVDAETGAATMIGLPRNMESFPFSEGSPLAEKYPNGYGWDGCEVDVCLLNSVYTEVETFSPEMYPDALASGSTPGIEGMRDAVQGITGLTVQYYALIDMQGFSDLINALGGVTIDVPAAVPVHTDETFSEVAFYIGPGIVHMDGPTALWYARSRHDTTDYDRMARQRQLQQAILEQFTPANVLSKFQGIAQAGSQVVRTDIPQSALGYFAELASKTKELPLTDVELVPASGVDPAEPDIAYIHELVAGATAPIEPEEPTD